jgi:Ca2+/Na+ antiporter
MKKEDKQMLVEFIILMAFFYLIPAFTLWKFDPSMWSMEARLTYALFAPLLRALVISGKRL